MPSVPIHNEDAVLGLLAQVGTCAAVLSCVVIGSSNPNSFFTFKGESQ